MSLTLVTGVPGSGKTLYSIAKLLFPILGTTVKRKLDDGTEEDLPRTIYTNINGLQLDHELIDFNGAWFMREKEWIFAPDPKRPGEVIHDKGIHHWHLWAKPGAYLFLDEFQKAWPPRANGAPVPPDIQALDTHRHMGVDMVLITQSVNNIDRHVLGLVDRHLHIRRFGNMPAAVVYEWDHASRSLLYRNSVRKTPWRYDRKVYKLYKSAEVHTKQRRNIPTLVWFVLVGLVAFAYLGPTTYNRLYARTHPTETTAAPAPLLIQPDAPAAAPAPAASAPSFAASAVAPAGPVQFSGCISMRGRCGCFDGQGRAYEADPAMCSGLHEPGSDALSLVPDPPPQASADDGAVIAWMRDR